MQELCICQFCFNICIGESRDRLIQKIKVLEQFLDQIFMFFRVDILLGFFIVCGVKVDRIIEKGLKVQEFELQKNILLYIGNLDFEI